MNITENFERLYHPKAALVFYQSENNNSYSKDMYVEHFDMDKNGNPTNAHPLTTREAAVLAKALSTGREKRNTFLKPKGILPANVLHINPGESGTVLWHTKAGKAKLFFIERLAIPNGIAELPALLWHAGKNSLSVFALASDRRPAEKTPLYHAPFFNVYENGNVCMGTVDVHIKNSASLEEFMQAWENYFFNSYFSHLINNHNPIKGNCVSLWKELIRTGKPFPKEVLRKTGKSVKNLI